MQASAPKPAGLVSPLRALCNGTLSSPVQTGMHFGLVDQASPARSALVHGVLNVKPRAPPQSCDLGIRRKSYALGAGILPPRNPG